MILLGRLSVLLRTRLFFLPYVWCPVTLMAYFINLFAYMESSDCRLHSLVSTLQINETHLNLCNALVGVQFYDMPWTDAVVRHVLVGTQFHDMTWSVRCLMTCTGGDPVLRHVLAGAQYYDIPGSVLIKSINQSCLIMFPQSTAVYFNGNYTNLTFRGCTLYMMRLYWAPNCDLYHAKY